MKDGQRITKTDVGGNVYKRGFFKSLKASISVHCSWNLKQVLVSFNGET